MARSIGARGWVSSRLTPALFSVLALCSVLFVAAPPARAASLEEELGNSEVRIRSAPFEIVIGRSVADQRLLERLEALHYRRVRGERPDEPGEYFFGYEVLRIYRRAHRYAGRDRDAKQLAFALRKKDGLVRGWLDERGESAEVRPVRRRDEAWLEPETLAESLEGRRAPRRLVKLEELPERAWRPVLAAEDARFFDHVGVDGRSLARAALANAKAGGVVQGGSTITQQLIKNRDLSPRRTLGRKVSEALRALALEARFDKEEILEAYLNNIYWGHVDGVAIHGIGRAAHTWFGKSAGSLTLAESAALAAMIQGPNARTPTRHAERLRERRDWVLSRMEELGWAGEEEIAEARRAPIAPRVREPAPRGSQDFLAWVRAELREEESRRLERGRGVVVETTLDPELQRWAETTMREHLARLRSTYRRLRSENLSGALVALDARTGDVVAHVGGDPGKAGDEFDRVRRARRQTGSAIKPLLLLEALETCGQREPLHLATRVSDTPLTYQLPDGPWSPRNFDGLDHGVVTLREALRHSYNVPFVRVADWCGYGRVAARVREAGLPVPEDAPLSFVLGAVEATPLQMAEAFTVFATPGRRVEARPYKRIEKPTGRRLDRRPVRGRGVTQASTAYLVHDLLLDAVEKGTGRAAALEGVHVAGKTGTSSEARDAWFVGSAEGLVIAVWVGNDQGEPLGLTGGRAAAPLWRRFASRAALSVEPYAPERPRAMVTRRIDPESGLRVSKLFGRGEEEIFRRRAQPRVDTWLRKDPAEPVLRGGGESAR